MKSLITLIVMTLLPGFAGAAEFADLQRQDAPAIARVNPYPNPSNPDSCYLQGIKDGLCVFKCRSGESFQVKPVKPEADSLYVKCGAGDYRAAAGTRADLNWKGLNLRAADGTTIRIDYALLNLGGTMIATPLWVTVNGALRGGEKVHVALMTFYKATASSADALKETKEFDLEYNGTAFQAKGPEAMIYEGHHAWVTRFRQEIAVSVNGKWLVDPVNGSHNFKFELGAN